LNKTKKKKKKREQKGIETTTFFVIFLSSRRNGVLHYTPFCGHAVAACDRVSAWRSWPKKLYEPEATPKKKVYERKN